MTRENLNFVGCRPAVADMTQEEAEFTNNSHKHNWKGGSIGNLPEQRLSGTFENKMQFKQT